VSAEGALRRIPLHGLQAVERLFDRAFGSAANPLRHLGALGFFLFWAVAASGIYLFIFFDTGIDLAYRSVEALGERQPWAGGVLRSLHRYASDAFVVVVLLHLAKEFLHGRYAGFRWFSWLTGVPLVWFMFASGVTGYWLVWDRLAQFVAIATTEWFDWLVIFGEPLTRNFLHDESVNSRFFTLMVFLHIGIPLVLLLGMFVHIQRVNHADVLPARVLGWGLLAAMLVLALILPATSLAPADLARVASAQALDWFYLFAYPLLYAWSPGALWALALLCTLALAALPFLTPVPAAAPARVDLANCNGCSRCFDDCPYGAVVMRELAGGTPGLPQALVLPSLCASCGICAGSCPSSTPFRSDGALVTGIDMPQLPVHELRARLDAALADARVRIVVFTCERVAAAQWIGGADVAVIELICVGQLPPSFIEYALRRGADGILINACAGGDCSFRLGERWMRERLAGTREPHLRASVPRQRVAVAGSGMGGEINMRDAIKRLRAQLDALPPPARRAPKPTMKV
jgi:coenzyme F420-reducing hydrogenase delta subunit/ferredoxin